MDDAHDNLGIVEWQKLGELNIGCDFGIEWSLATTEV
jgi:hypothetical protein